MALIELKDTTIRFKDGLSGTGLINEATPGATDTSVNIDGNSTNRPNPTQVPIGARFTVSTAGNTTKYTVTGRTNSAGVNEVQTVTGTGATTGTLTITLFIADPSNANATPTTVVVSGIAFNETSVNVQTSVDSAVGALVASYVAGDIAVTGGPLNTTALTFTYSGTSVAAANHPQATVVGAGGYDGTESSATTTEGEFVGQTTAVTFSPAWGTPTPADNDTITWLPIEVDVKIGEGNLTYTENKEMEYQLDRGLLDTVREGDQQPLDVTIDFAYEFVTTGTGEAITPVDALKGKNGASEFTSSATDPCEPYAIDIEIDHNPGQCAGSVEREITLFPDFRYDSLEFDLDEATISTTGRCNVTEPTITRTL